MKQNEALAAAAVQIALTHVGIHESTGNNDGTFVDALERKFGLKGEPWCAMYATDCIEQAAAKLGLKTLLHKSPSSTEIFAQAKHLGLLLKAPEAYCIGLLRGSGGTAGKDHHHTFLVVTVDAKAGIVHSVDGNWGNAITRTSHPIAACDFVAVC